MGTPVITPIDIQGGFRSGQLAGLTEEQITEIIGFGPNVAADRKNRPHWGFSMDGERCSVWSHRGSHGYSEWYTHGPDSVMTVLFGDSYQKG